MESREEDLLIVADTEISVLMEQFFFQFIAVAELINCIWLALHMDSLGQADSDGADTVIPLTATDNLAPSVFKISVPLYLHFVPCHFSFYAC